MIRPCPHNPRAVRNDNCTVRQAHLHTPLPRGQDKQNSETIVRCISCRQMYSKRSLGNSSSMRSHQKKTSRVIESTKKKKIDVAIFLDLPASYGQKEERSI